MLAYVMAAVVLLLAALVISYPLVFHNLESYALAGTEAPEEPYSERDALLESLSELELSYNSGKLSEDVYQAQKARLQREYIQVVEQGRPARG